MICGGALSRNYDSTLTFRRPPKMILYVVHKRNAMRWEWNVMKLSRSRREGKLRACWKWNCFRLRWVREFDLSLLSKTKCHNCSSAASLTNCCILHKELWIATHSHSDSIRCLPIPTLSQLNAICDSKLQLSAPLPFHRCVFLLR